MTVNDNTIKAEGLGHPFENIGKASAKRAKNRLEFAIQINPGTAKKYERK